MTGALTHFKSLAVGGFEDANSSKLNKLLQNATTSRHQLETKRLKNEVFPASAEAPLGAAVRSGEGSLALFTMLSLDHSDTPAPSRTGGALVGCSGPLPSCHFWPHGPSDARMHLSSRFGPIKTESVQIASPDKKTDVHFVPAATGQNALH